MGIVNIAEFEKMGRENAGGMLPIAEVPALATNSVTSSGASADSDAFNTETNFVRIKTDTDIYIEFGASPTAAPEDIMMAAGDTEYFAVTPGHVVAVIDK